MSKKIKIIFTLSFLLNIILLGVVLGGFYKMNRWHSMSHENKEIHKVFQKNMSKSRDEMKADFQKMKVLKEDLRAIITAEDFDKTAFMEKMNQVLEIKQNISSIKTQSLEKTLSELSQSQRVEVSDKVLDRLSEGREGKRPYSKQFSNKERHREELND